MERLVIAHISDFHLRLALPGSSEHEQRKSREMPDLVQRALQRAVRSRNPDVLIVSGDLLDVPFSLMHEIDSGIASPDKVKAVRDDYRFVRQLLEATELPYIVVPGNHDYVPLMQDAFFDNSPVRKIRGMNIVGFSEDTEDGANYPVRNLDHYTDYAHLPCPQIHVQHYVVTPLCNDHYPHTYRNAAEILEWNRTHACPMLSLSGHYHPGAGTHEVYGTWYFTAAAFCEPPHPWYIHRITFDPERNRPGVVVTQHLTEGSSLSV